MGDFKHRKSTYKLNEEASRTTTKKIKHIRQIDPEEAESFLRNKDHESKVPMAEQMFKNLGHLAPEHNIFVYYKNLAKIAEKRQLWLKRHPPAPMRYKRKKANFTIVQQKKMVPRESLHALPWKLDVGKMRSHYEIHGLAELRTASYLETKYGGKDIPRPWHKYQKILQHRRVLAHEQDDFIDYEFTNRERSINTPMGAVLFLHILEIRNVSASAPTLLPSLPICFYCIVSVGHLKKSSKITLGRRIKKAKLDFSVHFTLDISAIRNHYSNNVKLEVWCFQDPETQYVIGIAEFHLYELIKEIHGFHSSKMWVDGIKTGKIAYEFAFAYGCLGYGHSNQLKNTAVEIFDTLGNSMFPRVNLFTNSEESMITTPFETLIPNQLKMIEAESMMQQIISIPPQNINGTFLEAAEKFLPIPMRLGKVQFYDGLPIHCSINNKIYQSSIEADFNDVYGEYIVIRHRRDRLYYLQDMINGPQNDIEEIDVATYLFQELRHKDCEVILDTDEDSIRHGVGYVHPRTIKCDERVPIVLTKEDEKFMDMFPSVQRKSGYLDLLFGYSPLPPREDFLNDMDFPLIQVKIEKSKWRRCSCKAIALNIYQELKGLWMSIMEIWNYFFPNVTQVHDPDISVTTSSVPGSVTRIHSYFVNEDKDRNVTEVMKLVQKTTALLALEEIEEEEKREQEDHHKGVLYLHPHEQPLDLKKSACPFIKTEYAHVTPTEPEQQPPQPKNSSKAVAKPPILVDISDVPPTPNSNLKGGWMIILPEKEP